MDLSNDLNQFLTGSNPNDFIKNHNSELDRTPNDFIGAHSMGETKQYVSDLQGWADRSNGQHADQQYLGQLPQYVEPIQTN